jgi:hypothetical protein
MLRECQKKKERALLADVDEEEMLLESPSPPCLV